MPQHPALARAAAFCEQFNLRVPILMAPMASACPPSLAIAIANAGGLGGCGALMMQPEAIRNWAADVRAGTNGGFQFNLWIPDPPPKRDAAAEAAVRDFLANWGPPVPPEAGNVVLPDFNAQCDALLEAGPAIVSSIMGLYPDPFVARMKAEGVKWFATVTTVSEAKIAESAGADAVIAQGMEAGGHRSAFDVTQAETHLVGLFSLLPGVADAVKIPVVATGGIADGRGIAAALLLGASAVQIGTAFLRSPEAKIPSAWADAIGKAAPEDTVLTKAMTGRPARSIATEYVRAAMAPTAPPPAPYPVQRGLTQPMREAAAQANDAARMQAWAGQSARLARAEPAGEVVQRLWQETQALLG
ncbi:MAG TPA: nitronate monooxygenase [Xanthobacteraceae bacterium]|jgi:nitronate monooxygenase|nr:nitronate monooxygenase [Xanthobacteraceae bacterium]